MEPPRLWALVGGLGWRECTRARMEWRVTEFLFLQKLERYRRGGTEYTGGGQSVRSVVVTYLTFLPLQTPNREALADGVEEFFATALGHTAVELERAEQSPFRQLDILGCTFVSV